MTSNLVLAVEVLLIVGLVLYRQMATRTVKSDLVRMPVIIGGLGLINLVNGLSHSGAPSPGEWFNLVAGLALAAVIAVPRARSVRLWQGSDGRWMRRGTLATFGWWLAFLLSHVALVVVGRTLFGGADATGGGLDGMSAMLFVGVSLGVQGWCLERRLALIAPERRPMRSMRSFARS